MHRHVRLVDQRATAPLLEHDLALVLGEQGKLGQAQAVVGDGGADDALELLEQALDPRAVEEIGRVLDPEDEP